MNSSALRPLLRLLALTLVVCGSVGAQETGDVEAPLEIVAVVVEPGSVASDTLCRLAVELRNTGTETADAFAFEVRVAGVALEVYESQLFLDPIAAGDSKRIDLFNFWSSETGRDLPAEGPLVIEVELRDALWVEVATRRSSEGDASETVWESKGPVPGLPVSATARVDVER